MDNFSDIYHHLAAKSIIVHKLITKNVNFHILFLFLFFPPTLAFDCKCSLNNKSKINGLISHHIQNINKPTQNNTIIQVPVLGSQMNLCRLLVHEILESPWLSDSSDALTWSTTGFKSRNIIKNKSCQHW